MKRILMLVILMVMTAISLGTYATPETGSTYTTMGGCPFHADDAELDCVD